MDVDPASLDLLRDIVAPAAVAAWPPAPGVWLLASLVAVWLGLGLWMGLRRRHRSAYRREALRELARLRPHLATAADRGDALRELSRLVKRTALSAHPRQVVAGLSGDAWLAFLDHTGGGDAFRRGAGRPLGELGAWPDADEQLNGAQCEALATTVARWITKHRAALEIKPSKPGGDRDPAGPGDGGRRAQLRA